MTSSHALPFELRFAFSHGRGPVVRILPGARLKAFCLHHGFLYDPTTRITFEPASGSRPVSRPRRRGLMSRRRGICGERLPATKDGAPGQPPYHEQQGTRIRELARGSKHCLRYTGVAFSHSLPSIARSAGSRSRSAVGLAETGPCSWRQTLGAPG